MAGAEAAVLVEVDAVEQLYSYVAGVSVVPVTVATKQSYAVFGVRLPTATAFNEAPSPTVDSAGSVHETPLVESHPSPVGTHLAEYPRMEPTAFTGLGAVPLTVSDVVSEPGVRAAPTSVGTATAVDWGDEAPEQL